jgi:hypothetical protein
MDRADLDRLRRSLDQDVKNGLLYPGSWTVVDAHRVLLYIAKLEARIAREKEE